MLDVITATTGVAYFALISIATRQHFRSARYPWGMMVISVLSLLGIGVFQAHVLNASFAYVRLSLSLILAAAALFVWALGHSRRAGLTLAFDRDMQSDRILQTGPWRYMRHPFYASYLIFWLACALATQQAISLVVFVTLSAIYLYSALREEGALATGPLGAEYRAYRDRVGFLLPRRWPRRVRP